jgi:CheY-like chemotaxis protein
MTTPEAALAAGSTRAVADPHDADAILGGIIALSSDAVISHDLQAPLRAVASCTALRPPPTPARPMPSTVSSPVAASAYRAPGRAGTPAAMPGEPLPRVLLVEDNPADADLVIELLTGPGSDRPDVAVVRVDRLSRARAALAAEHFDVVLLDLSLPDAEQLDGIEALTAAAPEVPVVVMTALEDDRMALRAVHAGAQDYLVKGQDDGRVVRRAIRYAMERQELLHRKRACPAPPTCS